MKIDLNQGIDSNWSAKIDLKCSKVNCLGTLVFDLKKIIENEFPITIYCFHIPLICSACGIRHSILLSMKGKPE